MNDEYDTMDGMRTVGGFDRSGDVTLSGGDTQGGGGMTVLAGRYRVVRRLGEGGMGSVWLAEDLKLDGKRFAIKMLPAVLAGKKGAYRQVKAEALMAMKLAYPNIATVRAFEEDEGGNPFLVMDYIEGEGLDDILAERGPLGEDETVRLLGPVAAALDYAHSQGVVHRDVKPGNVIVAKDGTPFVLDFGIAREVQETLTRVTGKLSSGTLLYMSPEQLRGKSPTAAQDVYSFAAMAYECLTGHPPFFRGAIEDQIKNEQPEALPESVGEVLRRGVMAGLAKESESRPGTCAGVLEYELGTHQARPKRKNKDFERFVNEVASQPEARRDSFGPRADIGKGDVGLGFLFGKFSTWFYRILSAAFLCWAAYMVHTYSDGAHCLTIIQIMTNLWERIFVFLSACGLFLLGWFPRIRICRLLGMVLEWLAVPLFVRNCLEYCSVSQPILHSAFVMVAPVGFALFWLFHSLRKQDIRNAAAWMVGGPTLLAAASMIPMMSTQNSPLIRDLAVQATLQTMIWIFIALREGREGQKRDADSEMPPKEERKKVKFWGWGGGLVVLLVLLIIGSLLSLQIPQQNRRMRQAKANTAKSIIASICLAVRMYEVDNGKCPDSLQNLVTKGGEFNWRGPYLENGIPKDPWGNEFQYSKNRYEFTVTSAGPDGTFGTEDDITGQ